MRVATVDGLVTLFYDGSKQLWNFELHKELNGACAERLLDAMMRNDGSTDREDDIETLNISDVCKQYLRERETWQQIIVIEGVTEIPYMTFLCCKNIRRVIFANTVIRIEDKTFLGCSSLVFIKWSMNLQYIGEDAFSQCNLSSVFIPPTCREICYGAFGQNKNLSIFHVPQETQLGRVIIYETALAEKSSFRTNEFDMRIASHNVNQWLKNMNNEEEFALHKECSSFLPTKEDIYTIIQEKGFKAFKEKNSIGINPSQYLKENPYTDLTEKEIIHDYLMKMIGEVE